MCRALAGLCRTWAGHGRGMGELGRRVDVTTAAAEAVAAELTTDRASESVKAAASFALGGIAAGNPAARTQATKGRKALNSNQNAIRKPACRSPGDQGPTTMQFQSKFD